MKEEKEKFKLMSLLTWIAGFTCYLAALIFSYLEVSGLEKYGIEK